MTDTINNLWQCQRMVTITGQQKQGSYSKNGSTEMCLKTNYV